MKAVASAAYCTASNVPNKASNAVKAASVSGPEAAPGPVCPFVEQRIQSGHPHGSESPGCYHEENRGGAGQSTTVQQEEFGKGWPYAGLSFSSRFLPYFPMRGSD
jgi:hypothetical protein